MYTVTVRRRFVAQHFLIGGDWGAENERHSHVYQVELQLEGPELNKHGFLVDIVDIEATLDRLVAQFRDRTLNELPEFEGLNPSIEHLCRIFCQKLASGPGAPAVPALTVRIWEDQIAWASYHQALT